MRQLKFRAWNRVKNEWAYGYETLGGFSLFGELHLFGELPLEELNDLEVMQMTGLLDKNGKEIYEGDILKTDSGAHNKVCWRDDFACFCLRFSKGASLSIDGADKYEIIGNIWENPELTTPS